MDYILPGLTFIGLAATAAAFVFFIIVARG